MFTIPRKKQIRPTNLQPKLYSIVKELGNGADYRVIVDRDNRPMCVLLSYSLMRDIDLQNLQVFSEKELSKRIDEYYANMPEEDKEWLDVGIDDGIDSI